MFFFTTSFLVYVILVLTFMFLVLYIWRRLYGLEKYTHILEKKITNLKKENKGLHEIIKNPDSTSFDEAEVVMNSIFKCAKDYCNQDGACYVDEKGSTKIEEVDDVACVAGVSSVSSVAGVSSVSGVAGVSSVSSIAGVSSVADESCENGEEHKPNLPVADHREEVESVVSESNVFNRKKLSKMNLEKLKDICSSLELSTDGTKNALVDRILSQ